jgi:tetratricopeptide (TPR) repeat protein
LPRYVDLATDMALPGRDEEWYQITQWRVRFAFARSDLETATHLQQILTALTIKRAESAAQASAPLEAEHNEAVRGTAIALNELGNTQTHGGDPEAIATLERAVGLAKASGDAHLESGVMYSLAVALLAIPGHQDLDRAEALIVHALEMQHDTNTLFRSRCFGELGFIALQRMGAAIARQDEREALKQLETGIRAYEEGLRLTPADAEESLASKHLNLGTTYGMAGDDKAARGHWNDGIRFAERSGQVRTAARCRMCIARSLAADAREPDAAMYADRALRDLVSLGPQAESEAAAATEFLHSLSVGEDGE